MNNALDLQAFLFEDNSSRLELLNYVSKLSAHYQVSIYRNHSFELIENTIKPYLEYGGLGVEFSYSSYDDTLSFLDIDLSADLIILWLDLSNYTLPDLESFLKERITYLRTIFNGNILFAPCGDTDINSDDLHVEHYKLSTLQTQLGDKFFDLRLEPFAGTKLSPAANLAISRDLGLNYLPALLKPNLKGIVVDLDNTLYHGVLGEDGIPGIAISEGHRQLQKKLKELSQQGFFLCIASKNDERDVKKLFEERADFPLQLSDFVEIHAHWESKSESIGTIAKSLNVSVDSLLFIDDNVGELVSVVEAHPAMKLIWAKDNASITHEILSNYPGLLKLNFKKEDSLRKDDMRANKQRVEMQSSLSKEDYIKNLNMELVFELDNLNQVERVTELSNKTNQFIFSYRRYTLQQTEALMKNSETHVVTVSLKDRLSESGIIGVLVLKKQGQFAQLEECFVSCRALGRGIDQAIVLGGVKVALESFGLEDLKVEFTPGERNLPAEQFIERNLDDFQVSSAGFNYELPVTLISITIK